MPDIVFFGEALPRLFGRRVMEDFPQCDCLIVMGTSLKVQPFASLIDRCAAQLRQLGIHSFFVLQAASISNSIVD